MTDLASRKLVLLSRSPRRKMLLEQAGYHLYEEAGGKEPMPDPGESALEYVQRAARQKWIGDVENRDLPRLSADTVVALDDQIFGKPANLSEARSMLRLLSGTKHRVHTAVALGLPEQEPTLAVATSLVAFVKLSDNDVDCLAEHGMPYAGAYAIQADAQRFTRLVKGNLDTVIGLPVYLVDTMYDQIARNTQQSRHTSPAHQTISQ